MIPNKKRNHEKSILPLRAKIADVLDMPLDVIQKQEVSIAGNYSCIISGCLHIEEYAKENITVKSTEGRVCVYGDNLVIVSFLDDRVTVRGKIVSVEIRKGDTI